VFDETNPRGLRITHKGGPEVWMSRPQFLEALAERLQSSASVRTIYGDPIEAEGKVVIPVARVAYGLGGGFGTRRMKDQEGQNEQEPAGEGGGGGVTVFPVGVVEVTREQTRFVSVKKGGKAMWAVAFLAGFTLAKLLTRR
jgi:uncharacterized spore protein YtfJ